MSAAKTENEKKTDRTLAHNPFDAAIQPPNYRRVVTWGTFPNVPEPLGEYRRDEERLKMARWETCPMLMPGPGSQ